MNKQQFVDLEDELVTVRYDRSHGDMVGESTPRVSIEILPGPTFGPYG